jgi:hypothetical protein
LNALPADAPAQIVKVPICRYAPELASDLTAQLILSIFDRGVLESEPHTANYGLIQWMRLQDRALRSID